MSATVLPFPCKARIGRARHAADRYLNARKGCHEPYWRQIASNLRSQMEKAGIDPAAIDREVAEFQRIVVAEIRRQARMGAYDTRAVQDGDCA